MYTTLEIFRPLSRLNIVPLLAISIRLCKVPPQRIRECHPNQHIYVSGNNNNKNNKRQKYLAKKTFFTLHPSRPRMDSSNLAPTHDLTTHGPCAQHIVPWTYMIELAPPNGISIGSAILRSSYAPVCGAQHRQTDTDHATCDIRNNRPHLMHCMQAMRPNNNKTFEVIVSEF